MIRRAFVIAVCAAGVAAASTGAASATLAPTVTVNESAGNAAASQRSLGLTLGLNQSPGDAVKTLSLDLPPGLLIDEETDGGACLGAVSPAAACQIGSGTAVIAGASTPMSLYLVQAPSPADLAGVELVAGPVAAVGALTLRSSSAVGIQPSLYAGQQISFTGLPPSPIASLSFTLTGLTFPSSCVTGDVAVWASSQQRQYPWHAGAPFTVSGCLGLEYLPTATETIARDHRSTAGTFVINLITPPGDSASQSVKADVPANLTLNPKLDGCLAGTTCTVGTVTATSPIIPSGQLKGTMTLSGIERSPALSVSFPAPLSLQLSTSWSSNAVTIYTMPDLPLTSLTLSFTGNAMGRMFVVQCFANTFGAQFTPKSGAGLVRIDRPIVERGCGPRATAKRGRPRASGRVRGLAGGTPRLSLEISQGRRAPAVRSVSIRLPRGLSFAAGVAAVRRYLSLSGARVASAGVRHGALVLRFRRPTAEASLAVAHPLVTESGALLHAVSARHFHSGRVTVKVTDAHGQTTRVTFTVKV